MARHALFVSALVVFVSSSPAFSAEPVIGTASALGPYSLGGSAVTGPSEIIDGAALQTSLSPGEVHLANGAELRLAARSAGTLFSDHLELREGAVRLSHFDGYPAQVGQVQILSGTPGSEAIVRAVGPTIEIASLGGTIKVIDGGATVTRVLTGSRLSFENTSQTPQDPNGVQSGASAAQPAATGQQTPAKTGANPARRPGPISDKKAILWAAGICAVGALVVGLIAASEGKSPF